MMTLSRAKIGVSSMKQQAGNVLLICLALMLIMTLWGISSTRNSSLSLQSNHNAKMKQISFEAAEFAIRQAEQMLEDQITLVEQIPARFDGTNGRYGLAADLKQGIDLAMLPAGFDYRNSQDWLDTYTSGTYFKDLSFIEIEYQSDVSDINYLDRQPRVVIEYMGYSEFDEDGASGRPVFRLSAIAWGPHGLASSVIRTHYALNI